MKISIRNISAILFVLSATILSAETGAFSLFGENKEKNANRSNVVAITVNGAKITEGQIVTIAKRREEETSKSNPDYNQARKVVIWELVFTEVVLHKGKEKHISVSDKEVKETISQMAGIPYEEFKKNSANYEGDFSGYQRTIKARIMYHKLLLKEYAGKLEPTEEQMKAYYNEHISEYRYQEPEKYRLKIIQCWFDEDTNNPYQTEALAKADAQEILRKLQKGEDFDVLNNAETKAHIQRILKKHGIGQSESDSEKDTNDTLLTKEWLRRYPFSPEFENAVLALKPGQISDIIQAGHCFCIVKFIERVDEGEAIVKSFDEVKEQIHKYVYNKLSEDAFYGYMRKIMAEADIKFANEQDKIEMSSPPN
jgi:hypothetical protein